MDGLKGLRRWIVENPSISADEAKEPIRILNEAINHLNDMSSVCRYTNMGQTAGFDYKVLREELIYIINGKEGDI